MRKVLNFILKRKITITICVLLMVLGFGWLVWATTTIGENINIAGGLSIGGTEVITSGRTLQNVTAGAGIITSGTFDVERIPALTPSDCQWTSWDCEPSQSCLPSGVMVAVERGTTRDLCGTDPERKWLEMRICCSTI